MDEGTHRRANPQPVEITKDAWQIRGRFDARDPIKQRRERRGPGRIEPISIHEVGKEDGNLGCRVLWLPISIKCGEIHPIAEFGNDLVELFLCNIVQRSEGRVLRFVLGDLELVQPPTIDCPKEIVLRANLRVEGSEVDAGFSGLVFT